MGWDACSSSAASSSSSAASPGRKRSRDPEDEVYVDNLHSHKRYLSEIMASSLNGLTVGDSLNENLMESPSRSETTGNPSEFMKGNPPTSCQLMKELHNEMHCLIPHTRQIIKGRGEKTRSRLLEKFNRTRNALASACIAAEQTPHYMREY